MRGTPLERFEAKYVVDESGCWLWTGAMSRDGYGSFGDGERVVGAHRWSYLHFVGPIAKGLHLDHLCRVRHCVNPAHLEAVTPRENSLRGEGPTARNARKTHCVRGHEFTPENTYVFERRRCCRACHRIHKIQSAQRKAVA